ERVVPDLVVGDLVGVLGKDEPVPERNREPAVRGEVEHAGGDGPGRAPGPDRPDDRMHDETECEEPADHGGEHAPGPDPDEGTGDDHDVKDPAGGVGATQEFEQDV